ncbi:MAG: MoaD/ThiS family protein [Mycobacteriales bacterium]
MTRVVLPYHLRNLAKIDGEVQVAASTVAEVLDALEAAHPVLRGTMRDAAGKRRPFVRFFACQEDLSHSAYDAPLPAAVVAGTEPFLVIGAMAGG